MLDIEEQALILKAARLATAYGQDWNKLPASERKEFVRCVEIIQLAAEGRRDV